MTVRHLGSEVSPYGRIPRARDAAGRRAVRPPRSVGARAAVVVVAALAMVVRPENSTDVDPADSRLVRDLLGQALTAIERPILVGAIVDADGGRRARNVGQLWVPDGRGRRAPPPLT